MTKIESRPMKESGVGWIGLIPESWNIKPAKALFSNPSEPSVGDDVHLTPSQKYGVVPQTEYMEITGSRVVLNLAGADSMRHVEAGDYISHLRSFQGGLEYSTYSGKVSSAYTVLRPRAKINPGYFKYLFKSTMYVQGLQTTTDQLRDGQSIRYGQFALLELPYPSVEEQAAIAEFLDRETTQIDELVEKQLRLIETLNERKRALISHMIDQQTKNLPKIRLRHLVEINPSNGFVNSLSEDELVTFMPMERLHENGAINTELTRELSEVRGSYSLFQEGDVVVAKVTPCFENGKSAVATNLINRVAYGTTEITVLRPRPELLATYLRYVVSSSKYLDEGTASMTGAGGLKRVPENFVRNFKIGLPPTREQEYLVSSLDAKLKRMDRLVEVANQTTALLRERRQALISAAVTGKFDVRGN